MTAPARHRVEIAWPNGPWDTSLTWTDETPWLLGIGFKTGREPRDDQNRPAQLAVELDNRDGRFTMQAGGSVLHRAGFETTVDGWARTTGTTATTATQSTTMARAGTGSLQLRIVTSSSGSVWGSAFRRFLNAKPGRYYGGGGWIRPGGPTGGGTVVARTARAWVSFIDGSGATVGSTFADVVEVAGQWKWVGVLGLAPAGTVTAQLEIGITNTPFSTDELHFIDDVAFGVGDDAGPWRDLQGNTSTMVPFPPYWPNVVPRRPIRWLVDFGGTTYTRFTGVLEDLPTAWQDFSAEVAAYTAVGRSALLADMDLPGSAWDWTVGALVPEHRWRLEEPAGATSSADSGSSSSPLPLAWYPEMPDPTEGAPFTGGRSRDLGPWTTGYSKLPPEVAGTTPHTVVAAVRANMTPPTQPETRSQVLVQGVELTDPNDIVNSGTVGNRVQLEADVDGFFTPALVRFIYMVSTNANDYSVILDAAGTELARDGWFLVVGRRDGTVQTLDVNDQRKSVDMGTTVNVPNIGQWFLHGLPGLHGDVHVHVDEAAVWGHALSDAEVAVLVDAFVRPWAGDNASQRLNRISAVLGLPTSLIAGPSATSEPGHQLGASALGGKALAYLQQLAKSLRGRIVDRPDGVVELRTGGQLLAGTYATPQATFGQGPTDLPYESIDTDPSFQRIITAARAKVVNGTVKQVVADDEAGIYGTRGPTEGEVGDLLLANDEQAKDWATWLVNSRKDPDVALDPLVLHPLGHDAVTVQVLSRVLDDVVTVKRKHPSQLLVASTARLAGVEERITRPNGKTTWTVQWRLEPTDPTPYFVADGTVVADGSHVAF